MGKSAVKCTGADGAARGRNWMDLDIELTPKVRGRTALPFTAEMERELEPADLARLEVEQGISAPAVRRMNDRHHALAKALAQGISPGNAAIITGYSASRVSILKADPAFQDLLAFYRAEKDIAEADVIERLSNLTLSVVAELEDRLENNPEDIKVRELLDIATAGLDRTGHGPSSKLQVTNLTISPDKMAALAAGMQEANVKVIEARAQSAGTTDGRTAIEKPLADSQSNGKPREGISVREKSREETESMGATTSAADSVSTEGTVGTVDEVHR